MIKGFDTAFEQPSLSCMYKNGYRFVIGYTYDDISTPATKLLTAEYASTALDLGMGVICNFESAPKRALDGYSAGQQDAKAHLYWANKANAPLDHVAYVSVDFQPTWDELRGPVAQYFRGWLSVIPLKRLGIYGSNRVVAYLYNNGLVSWVWQTYAWSLDSSGNPIWFKVTHIRQTKNHVSGCNGEYDIDYAYYDDYGQWKVDMSLTDADIDKIAKAVWLMSATTDVLPHPGVDENGQPIDVTTLPDSEKTLTPATYLRRIAESIYVLTGKVEALEAQPIEVAETVVRQALLKQLDDDPNT